MTNTTALTVSLAALVAAAPVSATPRKAAPQSPAAFTYQNPMQVGVINGLRDPFILKVDGAYYLTGTGKPFFDMDYAKFGPPKGVPLYSSPDLKRWKFEGTIVPRLAGSWYQDRFWAPELHVKRTATGRRFYCTFNGFNKDKNTPQGVGLAAADKITGPYTVLTPDKPLALGNDADLFTDDDGQDYLFVAGVRAMPINLAHARVTGDSWEVVGAGAPDDWDTGAGIGREGPGVIKVKDTYYCFYSSWGRGYEVGYATAKNVRGPWIKYASNPIYGAQDRAACGRNHKAYTQRPDVPYFEVGHGQPFVGPGGKWWISAHFGQKQKPPQANGYWGWEQPGYDPLRFEDGEFKPRPPTWMPQSVPLRPARAVQRQPGGVTLTVPRGALRLQALTPRIVRVSFSPTGTFPAPRVPVINAHFAPTPFRLTQSAAAVTLATALMRAQVDRKTGAVRFSDAQGKTFLSETPDGRRMTATTLDGPVPEAGYTSALSFALPAGEAIYGLGQHQDGLMDYRGSVVTLEQTNREGGIPFLVSSRGYGVLWNNPAHTDISVGAVPDVPIPPAQLFTADGKPGGLTGEYFQGQDLKTLVATRTDAAVDFDWKAAPLAPLGREIFSVRWTGQVQAGAGGDYTFVTTSDDGVRLWVDGRQVIDDWNVHAARADTATVRLAAGSHHTLRLEYFQNTRDAVARLRWRPPGGSSSLAWTSEAADTIDYYVFYGPKIDAVIAAYRSATGPAPLPPKWALGYWQSKERYSTQQEWLDIAAEYRTRRLPIDNLVQDWFYWDPAPWGSHRFDPKRYPDPAAGIAALHDKYHLHLMISVWGKFAPGTPADPDTNFDAMSAAGFLYPPLGESARYYDPHSAGARALYWDLMRDQIFAKGVDAWWLDASEPEVDMRAYRRVLTAAGLGARVLNAFPLMHTAAVSSGQRAAAPDKRVFILTRSAYAGQQRTGAATWSGDITASWDVFAHQIPAGLNFCLSGIPYWTTDIGAFFVNYPGGNANPAYRELFTRWFEWGAFCPVFRVHGTSTAKEMWRFGPETQATLLQYDALRYRLMPYIYSQSWQVTHNGATLMRALVFDFPEDRTARESRDEFLFGPSVLVCPVTKPGAATRPVYLPSGTSWTDFWTGQTLRGGRSITAPAPISRMPLYVKAGSILPLGPDLQYVAEKPADPIELRVYRGADGAFTLYEDEGDNTDYERGKYATIPILWNEASRTLTLGARAGRFPGMLPRRTFRIVWVAPGRGAGAAPSPAADRIVIYEGRAMSVKG